MGKARILIVDDEEEICQVTERFLSRRKYICFTASSGKEALVLANKERPNLVLLDVRLNNESGLDILPKLKQIDKDVKVIMVTALDDEETIRKAKSLGADDYVTKPFTTKYLNDFILQKISYLSLQQKIGTR
jgi:DNA-binding response OmpR family regulator